MSKNNAPDSASKGAYTNDFIFAPQMVFVKQKAKLSGIEIHTTPTGYLVSRWGLTKAFSDSDEVLLFLKKMGVQT